MTQHRTSRANRRRLAAGIAAAGLTLTGLAVTMTAPAQAALPPECVTVGATVTCTLTGHGSVACRTANL